MASDIKAGSMTSKTPFPSFDFSKFMNADAMTWLDSAKLMECHQKNIDALTAANKVLLEGAETLVRRESELFSEGLTKMQNVAQDYVQTGTAQDKMAKQAEIFTKSFEEAFTALNELGQIITHSNNQAFEMMQKRFQDMVVEMQEATSLASKSYPTQPSPEKKTPTKP